MASKQAEAAKIIVTGTSRDSRRLEVAKAFGADTVVDVQKEDALAVVREVTGGRGVDASSIARLARAARRRCSG
jgi:threonine dehydrogenase-like Zn-dependent dehydrogenase